MDTSPAPRRLEVDGEVFEVRPTEDGKGHHFDWVSGPNPDYGFSSVAATAFAAGTHPPPAPPPAEEERELRAHIRWFLAQIDPDTGYMAD